MGWVPISAAVVTEQKPKQTQTRQVKGVRVEQIANVWSDQITKLSEEETFTFRTFVAHITMYNAEIEETELVFGNETATVLEALQSLRAILKDIELYEDS